MVLKKLILALVLSSCASRSTNLQKLESSQDTKMGDLFATLLGNAESKTLLMLTSEKGDIKFVEMNQLADPNQALAKARASLSLAGEPKIDIFLHTRSVDVFSGFGEGAVEGKELAKNVIEQLRRKIPELAEGRPNISVKRTKDMKIEEWNSDIAILIVGDGAFYDGKDFAFTTANPLGQHVMGQIERGARLFVIDVSMEDSSKVGSHIQRDSLERQKGLSAQARKNLDNPLMYEVVKSAKAGSLSEEEVAKVRAWLQEVVKDPRVADKKEDWLKTVNALEYRREFQGRDRKIIGVAVATVVIAGVAIPAVLLTRTPEANPSSP